jgi:branched-chain amino acid transport system permease protein
MSENTAARRLPAVSRTLIVQIVVFSALAAAPMFTTPCQTGLVVEVLVLALFAASYDLLVGYTGIVSFGHALPSGLGLYGFAIFATNQSGPFVPTEMAPFEVAILVALLLVAAVSLFVGYIAL